MENSRGGGGVIVQRLLIFYYHWKENLKKKCYSHVSVRFKVGCWGNRLGCHERALPTQAVLRRHARPWTQSYLTRGFQDKSRTASLWPSSEFCNFCKIIITLLNTLAALQEYKKHPLEDCLKGTKYIHNGQVAVPTQRKSFWRYWFLLSGWINIVVLY